MAQIANDEKNKNKPAAIIEKMVTGRLGKFYENNCLAEQSYVKDEALTVGKYTEQTAKEFGGKNQDTCFFIVMTKAKDFRNVKIILQKKLPV